jgi:predicted DNA-binding transcriptional regulator
MATRSRKKATVSINPIKGLHRDYLSRSHITSDLIYEFLVDIKGTADISDILRDLNISALDTDVVKKILWELNVQGLVEIHNFEKLEMLFVRAKTPVEIVQWKLDKAK